MFADRIHAGQLLAAKLAKYSTVNNGLVVALPRGGVPIGFEISQQLRLPLTIFIVRKLGVPGQEELAMGAIADQGSPILNQDIISSLGISLVDIQQVIQQQQQVIQQYTKLFYSSNLPQIDFKNKSIILVDDGIATGATIKMAIQAIKRLGCAKLIVAVPVAPNEIIPIITPMVDKFICLQFPEDFFAIGNWYRSFPQISSEQVVSLLNRANQAN